MIKNPKKIEGVFTKLFGQYFIRYYGEKTKDYAVEFSYTEETSYNNSRTKVIVIAMNNVVKLIQAGVSPLAVAYHELAHSLETNLKTKEKIIKGVMYSRERPTKSIDKIASIWNVLEDERIERIMIKKYKFLKEILEPLKTCVIPDGGLMSWRKGDTDGVPQDIIEQAEIFAKNKGGIYCSQEIIKNLILNYYPDGEEMPEDYKAQAKSRPKKNMDDNVESEEIDETPVIESNENYSSSPEEPESPGQENDEDDGNTEDSTNSESEDNDVDDDVDDKSEEQVGEDEDSTEEEEQNGSDSDEEQEEVEQEEKERVQDDKDGGDDEDDDENQENDDSDDVDENQDNDTQEENNEDIDPISDELNDEDFQDNDDNDDDDDENLNEEQAKKGLAEIDSLDADVQDEVIKQILQSYQKALIEQAEIRAFKDAVVDDDVPFANTYYGRKTPKLKTFFNVKAEIRNGMSQAFKKSYSSNISNRISVPKVVESVASHTEPKVFYGKGKDISFLKKIVIFEDVSGSTSGVMTLLFSFIGQALSKSFEQVEWWAYGNRLRRKNKLDYDYPTYMSTHRDYDYVNDQVGGGTEAQNLFNVMRKYKNQDYIYIILTDGDMYELFSDENKALYNAFKDKTAIVGALDEEIKKHFKFHADFNDELYRLGVVLNRNDANIEQFEHNHKVLQSVVIGATQKVVEIIQRRIG